MVGAKLEPNSGTRASENKKSFRKSIILALLLLLVLAAIIAALLNTCSNKAPDEPQNTETTQQPTSPPSDPATPTNNQEKPKDNTNKEAQAPQSSEPITVTVGYDVSVPDNADYTWDSPQDTPVTLPPGSTVEDALIASGVEYRASYGYVISIKGLSAGDKGEKSAWFFSVNGTYPKEAFNVYALKTNDVVVWHFSADGGYDLGILNAEGTEEEDDEEDGQENDDPGEVICFSGCVTNDQDVPLEDISIIAWFFDEETNSWIEAGAVFSDEEGLYQFGLLELGSYVLNFFDEAGGYLEQFYAGKDSLDEADILELELDSSLENLNVTLTPAASLTGCVVDNNSFALSGIEVSLYAKNQGAWQLQSTTATDTQGSYHFGFLREGSYTLLFADLDSNYFPLYWQEADELEKAEVIKLQTGQREINDGITLIKAACLQGTVTNKRAEPILGATIRLYALQENSVSATVVCEVQSDEKGAYSLKPLVAGQYALEVIPPDSSYAPQVYSEQTNLAQANTILLKSEQTLNIDFVLQGLTRLLGSVFSDEQTDVANIPISAINVATSQKETTTLSKDGSFEFGLAAGRYLIVLNDCDAQDYNPNFETTYYPDVPTGSTAEILTVSDAQPLSIFMALKTAGTYAQKSLAFVSERGDIPQTCLYDYNTPVTNLPEMTFLGYSFLGWYDAPEAGTKIEAGFRITKDTTLYAHWAENSYITITFNAYGGSSVAPKECIAKTPIGTLPEAIYPGFLFLGWYTSLAGNGLKVESSSVFSENTTLYAHWQRLPNITISFDTCGGVPLASQSIASHNALLFYPTPSKTGHSFLGWYTAVAGGVLIEKDYLYTQDTTLYAHWEKNESVAVSPDDNNTGAGIVPAPKPKSKIATLKKLTVKGAKLKPKFSAKKLSYSVVLSKKTKSVKIKVAPTHKGAKTYIKTSGKKYKKATAATIKLKAGKSTIVTIKVVAEDGKTVKYYKIKVKRKA
ncbi:MAG: InlB B-repeat-containing protein [Coriobacteriia bacterium]|nr:InlB B-repeat-containing protein [Coriobacteriia bacterium]